MADLWHGPNMTVAQHLLPPRSDDIVVTPGSATYNSGSGNWTVPNYNTLTIELWGGGATAGASTGTPVQGNNSTVSTLGLTAGGGRYPTGALNSATGGGVGGTASGGNTTNTNGGTGGGCSPANAGPGYSGTGGSSPNGGSGGAGVYNNSLTSVNGNPGNAPGGGGGGGNSFSPVGGGNYYKRLGGGGGAYVKHVVTRGSPGAPTIGALLAYVVAAAVTGNAGSGNGAAGRVKFTWS